jgi:AcrR family transcriptional regulator
MPSAPDTLADTNTPDADTVRTEPRERILAAAREVFLDEGVELATVREITLRAGTNVAAVNYYFGSKDELLGEVLRDLMGAYTHARIAALDACEAAAMPGHPSLSAVIEALVRPMVVTSRSSDREGRPLIRLILQIRSRPREVTSRFFTEHVDQTVLRFIDALSRAAPHLRRADVFWRYNFAIGAIMQVLTDSDPATRRLGRLSEGLCDTDDDETIIRQLHDFVIAGFLAPTVAGV